MKKRIKQFNIRKWTENKDSRRAKIAQNIRFFAGHPLPWLVFFMLVVYGFEL